MKRFLALSAAVASTLAATHASAAVINKGHYDAAKKAIVLNVSYTGGCAEHTFTLNVGACLETYPVQCRDVRLVEDAHGDLCEAYFTGDITIPLKDAGLDQAYFTGAQLTIHGDNDSSVSLSLPR